MAADQHEDQPDVAAALCRLCHQLVVDLQPSQTPPPVTLDSSLDNHLMLDSLGRVELLVRLESGFDVTLAETAVMSAETVGDLLRLLPADARLRQTPVAHTTAPSPLQVTTARAAAPADHSMPPESISTLCGILDWHAKHHPDKLHVRFYADDGDGDVMTYGQLRDGARAIAAGLQARGVAPSQTVMIMLPSGRSYFQVFMGILYAGAIPVPIYPPFRPNQIEEHLLRHAAIANNAEAVALITVPEAVTLAKLLAAHAPTLKIVVTAETLLQSQAPLRHHQAAPEDIAFLQYTSGSTGSPKGVVLTHANLLANIRAYIRAIEATPHEVVVSWLPLYHDMGLIGAWMGPLTLGAPLVLMSPLEFIARPLRWFQALDRYGGTISAAPNFAYEMCLRRLDDGQLAGLDLSRWRIALNGAEAVSPTTMARFHERFKAYGLSATTLFPVYGLAECSVALAFPPLNRALRIDRVERGALTHRGKALAASADDPAVLTLVGCGRPIPGHEIRIADDAGNELPDRHEGHIQFRGPSATSGYYRNPEATEALMVDGWLDSGDRGYMAEGDLFITGRAKDIIIRAGRNIYPEEIELQVAKLDGVRGVVAVFGGRDDSTGTERLVVVAELKTPAQADQQHLRGEIAEITTRLAGGPPDDIVLAKPGTVLKTSSGKVRRAATRALYESGNLSRTTRHLWWQLARVTASGLALAVRARLRRIQRVLYTGWAYGVALCLTLPVALLGLALPTLAARWRLVRLGIRLGLVAAGLRLERLGNPPSPPSKPLVLVSNHQSYLDGFLLLAALPVPVHIVAKAELRNWGVLRWMLGRLGVMFVERFDSSQSVRDTEAIADLLQRGEPVAFFAEGTLIRQPGLMPFRLGAFEVAARTRTPVLPLALRGSRQVLRDGQWSVDRLPLAVEFGPELSATWGLEQTQNDSFRAAALLRQHAREWVVAHCGEPDLEQQRPALYQQPTT